MCPLSGGEGKFRSSTLQPTLISAADIADIADADHSGRGKSPVMLVKMGAAIFPGENKITVSGKVGVTKYSLSSVSSVSCPPSLPPSLPVQMSRLGEYHHHKISIKWGCLDFVRTITEWQPSLVFSVQPTRINVDVLVQPDLGGKHCRITT